MNPDPVRPSSPFTRGRLLAGAAVLLLAAALAWALRPTALQVELAPVQRGLFEQTLEEDGVLRLVQRYTVAAPTSGELQRPLLKVGDAVREGDAVAVLAPAAPAMIDARTRGVLQQRVATAEAAQAASTAQVARLQTALRQAALEAERARRLAREQFVAPSVLDQATLAEEAAQQALRAGLAEQRAAASQQAEARAALARAEPAGTATTGLWTLRSPVAGQVVALHRESAGPVAAGQPLLDVGDTADMEAVVDLLSTDVGRLPPAAPVALDLGSGALLAGRVARIEPVAFTKVSALGVEEQRVNVHVALQRPLPDGLRLGDGFRVEARITVARVPDALRVPTAALLRVGEGWRVAVIDADGRARWRDVTIAQRSADEAVVTAGLSEGERVVRYPGNGITEGQRLREGAPR